MATESEASETRRPDPLSVLWRVLTAPQVLMVLLGLFALSFCILSLAPQIPPNAASDPQGWLAQQPGAWGSLGRVGWSLGLFDVARAAWFRALFALTSLVVGVRMVEATELAWRAASRGRWSPAAFRFWDGGLTQIIPAPAGTPCEVQAQVERRLAGGGWRLAHVPGLPAPAIIAQLRVWSLWTRPVAHAGLLVALVFLAVTGAQSWQSDDWQPRPGEIRTVAGETGLTLRLDAFDPGGEGSGWIGTAQSQITWLEGQTVLKQGTVRAARPILRQGVTVRQIGYVPTLRLRGWDEVGRPLSFRAEGKQTGIPAEAEVAFATAQARPRLYLPQQDLFLEFVFDATCANSRSAVDVYLLRGDAPDGWMVSSLYQSGTFFFQGLRLEVHLSYRPILRISKGFGLAWSLGGLWLSLVSLALGWLMPARLVWLSVASAHGDGATIRAVPLPGVGEARSRAVLAATLRDESAKDA